MPGGDSFQQVSFFTNSFDSRTQGVDAVLTVGFDLGGGKATLGLNGNYTKTDVIKASPVITADRERLLEPDGFVPKWKGNASFSYAGERLAFFDWADYSIKCNDYEIGRAVGRERVCKYGEISVIAGTIKERKKYT